MFASLGGLALGLLVGLRHAFEPDHLTAVSTLVTEAGDARKGSLLGAVWGLGHTLALVVVGVVLMAMGAVIPAGLAAGFEGAVAVMLIVLGARAIWRALEDGAGGPITRHRHRELAHVHAGPDPHVHLGARILAWRPLVVGVIHGLAGSGALTALVFARLPGTGARLIYMTLFGLGSVAGMAIASGLAGASVRALAVGPRARRGLAAATGALSIVIGVAWSVPVLAVLI